MPPATAADCGTDNPYTKAAGTEPLPGYKLLAPLGRGGFGEVWQCEAPGGLHKAIKFVPPSEEGTQLEQELAAFEQIKAIRHPFLLTLERVERIGGELVMVMELADRQLDDRYRECRAAGLPGIPRDELLGYLADAAEALDMIAARFGLQHLDVKPANLFLTAGRVKVGDYGLVSRLEAAPTQGNRGLTPKYVAPEVLRGSPSPRSDQYSLALVYHELLTGTFPYPARSAQQLMLMHVTAAPDLSALPPGDRAVVGRALAKKPDDRFGFCLEFARALLLADPDGAASPDLALRRARLDRSAQDLVTTPAPVVTPPPVASPSHGTREHPALSDKTQNVTLPAVARMTAPGRPLPSLVTARAKAPQPPVPTPFPAPQPQPAAEDLPLADAEEAPRVVLDPIRSVVPVARLLGPHKENASLTARDFAVSVVEAAACGAKIPQVPGDHGMRPDGTWVTQFPSTVATAVAPLKLDVVRGRWGMTVEQTDPAQVILRKAAPGGLFTRSKGGLEVVVRLPKPGRPIGEVTATGAVYGQPPPDFVRSALDAIPNILTDVRRELGNVDDRRKTPRVAATFPVSVYPIHSDGRVDPPVRAALADVSIGGACFTVPQSLKTKYVFVAFDGVPAVVGTAVLARLVRSLPLPGGGRTYGVEYRTDL